MINVTIQANNVADVKNALHAVEASVGQFNSDNSATLVISFSGVSINNADSADSKEVFIHNGKTYRKVQRSASSGDLILLTTCNDSDFTVGKVYELGAVDIDGDTWVKNDDEGDYNLFTAGSATYVVLEPVE